MLKNLDTRMSGIGAFPLNTLLPLADLAVRLGIGCGILACRRGALGLGGV